jgi:hypothetical protein
MKRIIGLCVLIVVVGWFIMPGFIFTSDACAAAPVKLELYNPTGAVQISQTFAPRLGTLEGKTVCELSDFMWEHERTFPLIRTLLQERFPTLKIVQYPQLPNAYDVTGDDALKKVLQKYGCQGLVIGNGG